MYQSRPIHYKASINATLKNMKDTNQFLSVYAKANISYKKKFSHILVCHI